MQRILAIGIKDLRLIFRDRAALLLMLLTPFLITLGLGFVSGAFAEEDENPGISDIPVMIINQDEGELGAQLLMLFESEELDPLIELMPAQSIEAGRELVDENQLAALLIVPPGFTTSMIPKQSTGMTEAGFPIEIYRSPSRPNSVSIIETIVERFVNQVDISTVLITSLVSQALEDGAQDASEVIDTLGSLTDGSSQTTNLVNVNVRSGSTLDTDENEFSVLGVLAPGMALFFLMFTVTLGGRSILQERQAGTLDRIQTTPTRGGEFLSGKVLGIFLSGVAQVGILIGASVLLYQLRWGNVAGVIALIISAALAATSWGLLLAGSLNTQEQVTGVGTAIMLLFGAISGTFIQIENPFVNAIGMLTPNQWALQGFIKLGLGQSFADILPNIGALWIMAVTLFAISLFFFRRKML